MQLESGKRDGIHRFSIALPEPATEIGIIAAVALIIRIIWMVYAAPVPTSDFETYRQLAEGILSQHQFGYPQPTAYRLPGYPFFLAIFMAINRSLTWLSFVNVVLSTALVALTYAITSRLTGNPKIARIASLVCALNPTFIFFAPILATEHLLTLLVVGSALILVSPLGGTNRGAILSGVLLGLAILTRGEAMFYLPVLLLANLLYNPDNRRKYWLPPIIIGSAFLIVFPWFLRNWIVIGPGSGLSTSGGPMFYYGHHERQNDWKTLEREAFAGLNEIDRSRRGYELGFNYLRQAGLSSITIDTVITTLRLYVPNDYAFLWNLYLPRPSPDSPYPLKSLAGSEFFSALAKVGYFFIALMALQSLVYLRKYPARTWLALLGIFSMNWFCYAFLFASTSRYRYAAEAIFCILAGVGLWELRQFFRQRRRPLKP